MRSLRKPLTLAATVALMSVGGVAHADNVIGDGDGVAPIGDNNVGFGTVACKQTVTRTALVALNRNGSTSSPQVFANGAVVTISASSSSAQVSASPAGTVTLPGDWETQANNTKSSPLSSLISLTPTVAGAQSATVSFTATGMGADGTPTTRTDSMTVSWTSGSCSTNTAPTAPGAPVGASPTRGGFTLDWAPSTDTQGDACSYTLEGRDADDASWSVVASGLTAPSYAFTSGSPTEGTWTFRVKAVESSTTPSLSSAYGPVSGPVVVDRSGPNAPTAAADRDAEYMTGEGAAWWKDAVTVTFTGSGDPALADGSAGSGVDSVTPSQEVSAAGPFTVTGTATDRAGNVSSAAVLSGNVDTAAPVVELSCPVAAVVKGSTAAASWSATDEGSGLATPAAGQVALDTSSIGSHTVSAPAGTAVDHVGHQSAAASCSYSVVYDFSGFFRPVDMTALNTVKAGQSVPVKFSLAGFQGMGVIASGSPTFTVTGANGTQTLTAGGSSLSYDPVADQYVYVWKTDKKWAGSTCTFALTLADGTTHSASFSFTK